jgi:hypothetical protein
MHFSLNLSLPQKEHTTTITTTMMTKTTTAAATTMQDICVTKVADPLHLLKTFLAMQ